MCRQNGRYSLIRINAEYIVLVFQKLSQWLTYSLLEPKFLCLFTAQQGIESFVMYITF